MTVQVETGFRWQLLGTARLGVTGTVLPASHPAAMLAFLVVQPPEAWTERRRIAEELSESGDNPLGMVRTYRLRANKLLAPHGIALEEQGSALRLPPPLVSDVAEFLSAFRAGDDLAAFGLYRGFLMQGFDLSEQWPTLRELRESLHQAWLLAATRALDTLIRQGDPSRVEKVLEGLLDLSHPDDCPESSDARSWVAQAHKVGRPDLASTLLRRFLPDEVLPLASYSIPPHPTRRVHLPVPEGKFIGRTAQLERLVSLLQETEVCFISVVGLGGSGKTRLAVRAAGELLERFAHGTVFVSLREVRSPEDFHRTLAHALDLPLLEGVPLERQILNVLSGRELLLILDNCESARPHLPNLVGLLEALLRRAPGLKLLTTSRERLTVRGDALYARERVVRLEAMEPGEAEALFLRLAGGEATHPPELRAALLPRLAGLPLAIELVARRVAQGDTELLSEVWEGVAPEALFERVLYSSLRALTPQARVHLLGLSVFQGGCTLKAAAAVLGVALPDLTLLERASLLTCGSDERFGLHPLIAEGLEREREREREHQVRHARYYLDQFAACSVQALAGRDLHDELANLRAAWNWALGEGWFGTGDLEQGFVALTLNETLWAQAIFEQGLAVDTACGQDRMRAHYGLGTALKNSDPERALDLLEAALKMEGPPEQVAQIHLRMGLLWLERDQERATSHLEASRHLAELSIEQGTLALALRALGRLWSLQGQLKWAEAISERSVQLFEAAGDVVEMAKGYTNLGIVRRRGGDGAAARRAWEHSENLYTGLGSPVYDHPRALNLGNLAVLSAQEGDYLGAASLYAGLILTFDRVGDLERRTTVHLNRADCLRHIGDLGSAAVDFAQGLTLAQKLGLVTTQLDLLAGCALLLESAGVSALALEVAALVTHHPQASRGAKAEVAGLGAYGDNLESLDTLTRRVQFELRDTTTTLST